VPAAGEWPFLRGGERQVRADLGRDAVHRARDRTDPRPQTVDEPVHDLLPGGIQETPQVAERAPDAGGDVLHPADQVRDARLDARVQSDEGLDHAGLEDGPDRGQVGAEILRHIPDTAYQVLYPLAGALGAALESVP